jgi:hypothetical protein
MKKLLFNIVAVAVTAIMSVGCAEEPVPVNGAAFEVESYNDFWWKKYSPDTLKFVINTEFKECSSVRRSLVLALCDDANGAAVPTDVAQVYVEGVPAADNKIVVPVVDGQTSEIEIGVVVANEYLAEDAVYNWHIKLCDDAGLARVLSKDQNGAVNPVGKDDPWMLGMDVCVNNNHVANSLKVWANSTLIVVLIALAVWIALAHMFIWPSTKFSKVLIDYHDGAGQRPIRMSGCYQLVLTDQRKSDSLLTKIFKGSCKYEQHPFWTHEVIIKNSASRTSLRVANLRTFYVEGETLRGQEFDIVNEAGERVTIQTS